MTINWFKMKSQIDDVYPLRAWQLKIKEIKEEAEEVNCGRPKFIRGMITNMWLMVSQSCSSIMT